MKKAPVPASPPSPAAQILKYTLIAVSAIVVLSLLYYFRTILTYVLIAWVVALLGEPLMRFFRNMHYKKIRLSTSVSATLVLLIFSAAFVLLGWIFIPPILEQAHNLSNIDQVKLAQAFDSPLRNINHRLQEFGLLEPGENVFQKVQGDAKSFISPSKVGEYIGSVFSWAGHLFILLGSVYFIAFFFLKEEKMFVDFLSTVVPQRFESHIRDTVEDVSLMLTRYFGGITLQVLSVMMILLIGLYFLGIKSAILIAAIAALLNIIPYVGFYIGFALGIFLTITSNLDMNFNTQLVPLLIKVSIVFIVAHLIDSFFLQPFIFSKRVLAHPLEIFLVILIGAQIGGILGMLMAIPAYTVLRVVARTFLYEYRFIQKLTDSLEEMDDEGV